MIPRCRNSPITTVHFKRQLSVTSSTSTAPLPSENGHQQQPHDPFHNNLNRSVLGGLRASTTGTSGSTHTTQSLCSDILKSSARKGHLCKGKQVHSVLHRLGFHTTLSLQNQLMHLYLQCGVLCDAHKVFDEIPVRNIVTYNTMICGSLLSTSSTSISSFYLPFSYLRRMRMDEVVPNDITLNALLRHCVEIEDLEAGEQLHCLLLKLGMCLNCFVCSALVDLYSQFGLFENARRAFEQVVFRDLVLWNVMVSCYALNHMVNEAFRVFNLMRLECGNGDDFTYSNLLSIAAAPGSCAIGRQMHGLIVRQSFQMDILVASALINMYAKNEDMNNARKAFDEMPIRNVVSWTTMIVGYGRIGDGKEAMKLLQRMLVKNFIPDELTLATVLSACGNMSATGEVEQIHARAIKSGFQHFSSIANALVKAYAKCGSISRAVDSFGSIVEPDLVAWTSIIGAYACNGLPNEGLESFEKMLSHGIYPDKIAFLGVLSACSHGGLVSEGIHYFNLMSTRFDIMPDSEHYTCIIDLLGRAGLLDEAFDVLNSMPFEPEPNSLSAFIGACKVYRNVEFAKWAAEKLFRLQPNEPVNYAALSNAYACAGQWLGVARMRKMMRERCGYKTPGCSWVEIAGEIHTFVSCDESHPEAVEIYAMLGRLIMLMKEDCNDPSPGFRGGFHCYDNLLNLFT